MAKTLAQGRKPGSGRPPSADSKLRKEQEQRVPITDGLFIPNLSGEHTAGTTGTPVKDSDIANKKYVDDNAGVSLWEIDGTETQLKTADEIDMQTKKIINVVDPTANQEAATKKYVDDNVGAGDVTAGANLTDDTVVLGDGGAKGVKSSAVTDTELETLTDNSMADTLHRHSELSASDGTPDQALTIDANGRVNIPYDLIVDSNLLFVDVAPGYVGIGTATPGEMLDVVGNAEINGNIIVTGTVDGIDIATDVAANTLKDTNVTTNLSLGAGNATTEIVACSDGTDCTLIEADTDNAGLLGAAKWDEIVANSVHTADNTQAHTDYLLNSAADVGVGLTLTGDNASADTAYVPMVLYNTDATPPAASGFPIGTLYVQYTA